MSKTMKVKWIKYILAIPFKLVISMGFIALLVLTIPVGFLFWILDTESTLSESMEFALGPFFVVCLVWKLPKGVI